MYCIQENLKTDNQLKNLIDRIRLLFRKDKESYRVLYEILGFLPSSLEPYKIALTHSSLTASAQKKRAMCNERLEFLGDAVIELIVIIFLCLT